MAKLIRRPRTVDMEPEATQEDQVGFWEALAALDEKGWEHHSLYVYRVAPRIDTGGKAYIAKYSTPVDEAQLLSEHGSGRYLLMLNDTAARKAVAKLTFTAHHDDHPPKVRLDQVVDCPENGKWLAWLRNSEQSQRQSSDSPADGANTAVENIARMALEGKQRIDPQIVELWTKTAAERDQLAQKLAESSSAAPNPIQMVRDVMSTARELAPPPPPPPRSDLEVLDKVLSITKHFSPQQQPAANPVEQLTQVAGLFSQLRESFGTHEVAPAPAGPGMGMQILAALAPAIVPLAQAVAARILKGDAPPPAGGEVHQPAALPDERKAVSAGVTQTNPEPAPNPMSQLAEQIVPMLVNALNVGASGEMFANSIATLYGAMAYQAIAVNGREQILAVLKVHPMWPQLAPLETKLGEFVDEFLEFGQPDDDENEPASAA